MTHLFLKLQYCLLARLTEILRGWPCCRLPLHRRAHTPCLAATGFFDQTPTTEKPGPAVPDMARQQLEQPSTLLPLQLNGNELTAGAGLAVLRGINPLITSTTGAACIMGLKAAKDATSREDAPLGRVSSPLTLHWLKSSDIDVGSKSEFQHHVCTSDVSRPPCPPKRRPSAPIIVDL